MIPDVLVVGAGLFGLSVAWSARLAGLSVRVVEAERVGAGASGGPVGALAPHAPARWGPLQGFQLSALASLPDRIAALEAASGRSIGYARTGRLIPLSDAAARARAEADAAAALQRWRGLGRYEVLSSAPPGLSGWIAAEAETHGVARDTLSARIEPAAYLGALSACLGPAVTEGVQVRGIAPKGRSGLAVLTDGGRISAGLIVLAAGWRLWGLLAPLAPALQGGAVKGQAALLGLDAPGRPLLTGRGLYIVPHAHGVAVGSTSEAGFTDPHATDQALDNVLSRARDLCPPLRDAPVLRRWAGLRPRPPGRMPVIGPLPQHSGIHVAGGGFRIGIGIAHAVGDALIAGITGGETAIPLPAEFLPGA